MGSCVLFFENVDDSLGVVVFEFVVMEMCEGQTIVISEVENDFVFFGGELFVEDEVATFADEGGGPWYDFVGISDGSGRDIVELFVDIFGSRSEECDIF